jgi:hypothetical protein
MAHCLGKGNQSIAPTIYELGTESGVTWCSLHNEHIKKQFEGLFVLIKTPFRGTLSCVLESAVLCLFQSCGHRSPDFVQALRFFRLEIGLLVLGSAVDPVHKPQHFVLCPFCHMEPTHGFHTTPRVQNVSAF